VKFPLRILRTLHLLEDTALILSLVIMLCMALLQIVMRNFFESGFLWAESFLRVLVLWVAVLGAMVATRERNHINIDLISRFLANRHSRWAERLTNIFSAFICTICAFYAVEYIQYEFEDGTIAFGFVPVWITQSIIPVGFIVMACRFVFSGIWPVATERS
jgi:TRAP-type C4-dicarboxylate transport system permease small subunit